jgi:hypothetical protein
MLKPFQGLALVAVVALSRWRAVQAASLPEKPAARLDGR